MKKKNLKLTDLKVQSFVTSLEQDEQKTLQGGAATHADKCSQVPGCGHTAAAICNYTCSGYMGGGNLPVCACPNTGCCTNTDPLLCA
ncbi:MAG: hypothetical protein JWO09_2810 [Bacteroidetes bacterium]|nr:hypothetical protein [Bacteroidota bacterium]